MSDQPQVKRKPGRPRKNERHAHPSNWPETEAGRVAFLEWRPKCERLAREQGLEDVTVEAFDAYNQVALCASMDGVKHAVRLPITTLHLPYALIDKLKREINAQAQASVGDQAAEREGPDVAQEDHPIGSGLQSAHLGPEAGLYCGQAEGGCGTQAAVRLQASELETLHREAWETFEYDAPRGKTDSLGRIWSFDPEIKNGIKAVNLSVRRTFGPRYGTVIEVPVIGYQEARSVVEQIVNRLDGEVA